MRPIYENLTEEQRDIIDIIRAVCWHGIEDNDNTPMAVVEDDDGFINIIVNRQFLLLTPRDHELIVSNSWNRKDLFRIKKRCASCLRKKLI